MKRTLHQRCGKVAQGLRETRICRCRLSEAITLSTTLQDDFLTRLPGQANSYIDRCGDNNSCPLRPSPSFGLNEEPSD
jgi:hypothetical protein